MINISRGHFKDLKKKGLNLDMVYLLLCVENNEDLKGFDDPRIESIIDTLERKTLLSDGKLTDTSREILSQLRTENQSVTLKQRTDCWERFLKAFPPNNKFIWNGRQFEGDRSIRKNTRDGKSLFEKILNEGEYTCDGIIGAVIYEAIQKMESSCKTGQNKMNYFVNTESYLRQRLFQNFYEEGLMLTMEDIQKYYNAYNRKQKPVTKTKTFDI